MSTMLIRLSSLLLLTSGMSLVWSQEKTDVPAAEQPRDPFPLDRLTLRDGSVKQGLLLRETATACEFAEIIRPPGKSTYAVVRPLPREEVQAIVKLNAADRAVAERHFHELRHRAQYQTWREEQIRLERLAIDGRQQWYYAGDWFTLASTADEASVRRVIVRLEQLFLAFRQYFPPRHAGQPLTVRLFGSRDEYRDQLRAWQLTLENPAFYSSSERTIVASSNLQPWAEWQQAQAAEETTQREELRRREVEFAKELTQLTGRLKERGFTADEIVEEVRARRSQWDNEQKAWQQRMADARRRNELRYREATNAFFARLAHEAFHGYLETHVYPPTEYAIPRWLNEGLAQVFETAQLDGDLLRIDAPSRERWHALKAEATSPLPLPLTQLLTTDDARFLALHDRGLAERLYLVSWGVAWQVTTHTDTLAAERLDAYLQRSAAATPAVRRFEAWQQRPLAEWEREWRQAFSEKK